MLKMGTLDEGGRDKALDVIERNTRVQAQLIEDLLDMARFIRGTVRLEMQPVDLGAVLESAVDAVKPAADARRVVLSVDAPRGVAVVSGDSSRLQQVAWNLLSNSIKFSEAGDQVDARSRVEGDDAVLRVTDTGIGDRSRRFCRTSSIASGRRSPTSPASMPGSASVCRSCAT